jgi:uncharacterized protein with ParB-like and HNH nuclease domain
MTKGELALFETPPESIQPPTDVVAFNELRSCADLFRLYKEGVLEIQPEFQRDAVWKKTEQSTFIDSLVKQLPIPSMCFSLDHKTQKWQVVDGLQRMTAIVSFLDEDKEWRLSRIPEIDSKISGRTNLEIRNGEGELQIYYRRIQNLSLPITVIRCDQTRADHSEYLFTIFHRLNAGGIRLNNQEIRNCIFTGPFNRLLRELDQNNDWRLIKELLPSKGSRFRSIELILRFFAMNIELDNYKGNLAKFLNDFMRNRRFLDADELNSFSTLFTQTTSILTKAINNIGLNKASFSLIETAMIGIAANLNKLQNQAPSTLGAHLRDLSNARSFSSESMKFDTSATEKVKERVIQSRIIFSR